MSEHAAATPRNRGCSYQWVLPALDAAAHRRLRASLGRWAAGGGGRARSWQVGRALGAHVHVIVRMPVDDTASLRELAPEIDALAATAVAAA